MKRWTGNREISQGDGWDADLIVYSNHSHNDWVLLIADSILSQSLGEGKGDRNLMANRVIERCWVWQYFWTLNQKTFISDQQHSELSLNYQFLWVFRLFVFLFKVRIISRCIPESSFSSSQFPCRTFLLKERWILPVPSHATLNISTDPPNISLHPPLLPCYIGHDHVGVREAARRRQ